MMKNELPKKAAALTAAAVLALSCAASSYAEAEPENTNKVDELINDIYYGDYDEFVQEPPADDGVELPSKFDLRDVDGVCYVPEIRSQSPFGTCWSFGAIAAAEISVAYALGIDFNTATEAEKAAIDFSEKHLAWFSYTPLPENSPFYSSQSGEGYHYKAYDEGIDTDEETWIPYDFGGNSHYASVLFSEGVGPTFEFDVPYLNNEGKWSADITLITVDDDYYENYEDFYYDMVAPDKESIDKFIADYKELHPGIKDYDTEYDGPGTYYKLDISRTECGDWSVDESQRFKSVFLKQSNILPAPAVMDDNMEYAYNEAATRAIKEELYFGRGVAINIYSDHSRPEYTDESENSFLSFHRSDGGPAYFTDDADIWAHYTYCAGYDPSDPYSGNYCMSSNHVVCIVGYDDDFPKEYFHDPNGTIGGNGAWIARNSWGSRSNSDVTAEYDWGNGGDGYFYISYYDQSLDAAESYEFSLFDPEDEGRSLELYDLFPQFNYITSASEDPIYMANVFTAKNDEVIRDVGIMTALPELTARVSVYLLNDGFTSPTDGKTIITSEETFEYKGYHTMRLDSEAEVSKGQQYSVVLELLRSDGKYIFEINSAENKAGHDSSEEIRKEMYIEEYGSLEGYEDTSPLYAVMVVNKGESWLGAGDGTSTDWKDLTDVIDTFKNYDSDITGGAYTDYDNFPIRSYPYTSLLEVHNTVKNEKAVYDAGDVIEGTVTVDSFASLETYYNILIKCSLFDFGTDGIISKLAPGNRVTLDYTYTVTEEDLGKNELTSEVTVYIGGDLLIPNPKFSEVMFTVRVADKKTETPTAESEPPVTSAEQQSEPQSEPPPDKGAVITPIIIIVAVSAAAAVLIAVVITVLIRRKRK